MNAEVAATAETKPEKGRSVIWQRVQDLETKFAQMATMVEAQALQLERQDLLIGRLAEALGRRDLLTPPATVEQLRAAYKAGRSLLILKDCKSHGLNFSNGTKVEARQFQLEDMVELLERGLLAVAIAA